MTRLPLTLPAAQTFNAPLPHRLKPPWTPLVLAAIAALLTPRFASADSAVVEVTGRTDADRKDASAAKVTVTAADLARFGDSNLADAMQRIPGVTVERTQGQGTTIKLRGLGRGYTQVLLNGDPVPQGFSIDALAPSQIERIEVLRTATSDMSQQAIAGTINIVTRRATSKRRADLKAQLGYDGHQLAPLVSGQFADGTEQLSYGLGASLSVHHERWPAIARTESRDTNGQVDRAYRSNLVDAQREDRISLTPSLTWKPASDESLSVQGLLQTSRFDYGGGNQRSTLQGLPPTFASDHLDVRQRVNQARLTATWKTPIGEQGRLETRLGYTLLDRNSSAGFFANDAQATQLLRRSVSSHLTDRSLAFSGKYSLSLGGQHALDAGWDLQRNHRAENRIQAETSTVGFPTLDLDEAYSAVVSRHALYLQDAWDISKQLSLYVGARYELLSTHTRGNVLTPVAAKTSALSPTLQVLWRLPHSTSDQIRLALARTFKAPTTRELIPRRWVVNQNSASTPNFQGNPDLLPELAWGLDLGYERHLAQQGFFGVNLFARQIDRVVLSEIRYRDNAWVESPVNAGQAQLLGLELEAKGKLKALINTEADIDLRAGLARYWSRVNDLAGPGNRLSRQPRATANLGADWRLPGQTTTLGLSLAVEERGLARLSAEHSLTQSDRYLLDAYALVKLNKDANLRISINNVLARGDTLALRYAGSGLDETTTSVTSTVRTLRLTLEFKL